MGRGMNNKRALRQAIGFFGSQAKLAKTIGVSRQRINYWLNRDNEIPYRFALAIESATQGTVSHRQLLLESEEVILKPRVLPPITLEYLAHQHHRLQQDMGTVSEKVAHILSLLQTHFQPGE